MRFISLIAPFLDNCLTRKISFEAKRKGTVTFFALKKAPCYNIAALTGGTLYDVLLSTFGYWKIPI